MALWHHISSRIGVKNGTGNGLITLGTVSLAISLSKYRQWNFNLNNRRPLKTNNWNVGYFVQTHVVQLWASCTVILLCLAWVNHSVYIVQQTHQAITYKWRRSVSELDEA